MHAVESLRHALVPLVFATLAAGCITQPDVPEYGNVIKTCTSGQACDCTVTGNCSLGGCAAGTCNYHCTNLGNCYCTDSCTPF